MSTIEFTTWKVKIHTREDEHDLEVHFVNEALAQLAVEWAYAAHVEQLQARTDVHELKLQPQYVDGSKKVTWWKKTPEGFICMKDYFSYDRDDFRREIIGEAA